MNGKAKTAPRPTQGNKSWEELGGIFFTLLGYLAFNKKENKEIRKLSFLTAPASYFHNLPNSMAQIEKKFLTLPEILCLISSGYLLALQSTEFCQQNTTALLPT